jgi:dUTP pyrophosphatase
MQQLSPEQVELFLHFREVQDRANALFKQKSVAYGFKNIADTGEEGVLVRMRDKFARLENKGIPGESIDDTLLDIMNYAAILLLLRAGKWPGYAPDQVQAAHSRQLLVLADGMANIDAPVMDGDVGYDLRAAYDTVLPINCAHGGPVYVPTGVRIKAPAGVWTRIVGRSSTVRRGIVIPDNVIDNGYTGELLIPCFNFSGREITVKKGERLAQLVGCPMLTPKVTVAETLPETPRGQQGFGSTG